jgi:hypothetical protein
VRAAAGVLSERTGPDAPPHARAPLRRAGVLHTVLFHRTLGVIRAKDVQLSLFDVVFVRARPSARAREEHRR